MWSLKHFISQNKHFLDTWNILPYFLDTWNHHISIFSGNVKLSLVHIFYKRELRWTTRAKICLHFHRISRSGINDQQRKAHAEKSPQCCAHDHNQFRAAQIEALKITCIAFVSIIRCLTKKRSISWRMKLRNGWTKRYIRKNQWR